MSQKDTGSVRRKGGAAKDAEFHFFGVVKNETHQNDLSNLTAWAFVHNIEKAGGVDAMLMAPGDKIRTKKEAKSL